MRAGAAPREIMEGISVAAEVGAGAAFAHVPLTLEAMVESEGTARAPGDRSPKADASQEGS
jgi:hypothetical protein